MVLSGKRPESLKSKMTPLLEAVISDDLEAVKKLKDSKWKFTEDRFGFTPYELAQFLGRTKIEALFTSLPELPFKVEFPGENPRTLSREEFQEAFGVVFRPYLTFPSYDLLKQAVHQCPYLLRSPKFASGSYIGAIRYQRKLVTGYTAPIVIKWIDDNLGWGAFAAEDIAENAFVGECTGVFRRLFPTHPDPNPYCFHYPTKLWSRKVYIVDPLKEGNCMRFINHSDTPNLKFYWFIDRRLQHLCFFSKRKIQKGEQLFYDYGKDYWRHRKKETIG